MLRRAVLHFSLPLPTDASISPPVVLLGLLSRSCSQTSLDRLDQGGSGRVRPGDFMAAVRQVGNGKSAPRVDLSPP